MRLSDFDYHLPPELIAQYPTDHRGDSRLLVKEGDGAFRQMPFREIDTLLEPGDLVVINDTRVIPARLQAAKPTGGQVEIMLERLLDSHTALVQLRANKPVKKGQRLLCSDIEITVDGRQGRFYVIRFEESVEASTVFHRHGTMPLPPYIKRDAHQEDTERYQTVFSRYPGAVAAPTAGLHFDRDLIDRIQQKGIGWQALTLHVGAGTFLPIQTELIEEHEMHAEWITVGAGLCDQIERTRSAGGRVIAVGTTVVRALETAALSGRLQPYQGETRIFITPGFEFRVVDRLITNFHLPKSTLLMLVSAFAGYDYIMAAYRFAIDQKMRFFSYGDVMLLDRKL